LRCIDTAGRRLEKRLRTTSLLVMWRRPNASSDQHEEKPDLGKRHARLVCEANETPGRDGSRWVR
jgi:hypothetical protein